MSYWASVDIELLFATVEVEPKSYEYLKETHIETLPKLGVDSDFNDEKFIKYFGRDKLTLGKMYRGNAWYSGDFEILHGSEGSINYKPNLLSIEQYPYKISGEYKQCYFPIVEVYSTTNLRDFRDERGGDSFENRRDQIDQWIKNVFDHNWLVFGDVHISYGETYEHYLFIDNYGLDNLKNLPHKTHEFLKPDMIEVPTSNVDVCVKIVNGKAEIIHSRPSHDVMFINWVMSHGGSIGSSYLTTNY